jgi:hypothetical protein
MRKRSMLTRPANYWVLLIVIVTVGCNPAPGGEQTPTMTPTSTPEKLRIISGEIDACQLVTPAEIETLLGIKVMSELRFAMIGAVECTYVSRSDEGSVFQTFVTTDTTLKKVDAFPSSAVEAYEMHKTASLKLSEILKIEDIEDLGDHAFLVEAAVLEINVLNNGIYYNFNTLADGGIGYDALLKLVQIALQRMP